MVYSKTFKALSIYLITFIVFVGVALLLLTVFNKDTKGESFKQTITGQCIAKESGNWPSTSFTCPLEAYSCKLTLPLTSKVVFRTNADYSRDLRYVPQYSWVAVALTPEATSLTVFKNLGDTTITDNIYGNPIGVEYKIAGYEYKVYYRKTSSTQYLYIYDFPNQRYLRLTPAAIAEAPTVMTPLEPYTSQNKESSTAQAGESSVRYLQPGEQLTWNAPGFGYEITKPGVSDCGIGEKKCNGLISFLSCVEIPSGSGCGFWSNTPTNCPLIDGRQGVCKTGFNIVVSPNTQVCGVDCSNTPNNCDPLTQNFKCYGVEERQCLPEGGCYTFQKTRSCDLSTGKCLNQASPEIILEKTGWSNNEEVNFKIRITGLVEETAYNLKVVNLNLEPTHSEYLVFQEDKVVDSDFEVEKNLGMKPLGSYQVTLTVEGLEGLNKQFYVIPDFTQELQVKGTGIAGDVFTSEEFTITARAVSGAAVLSTAIHEVLDSKIIDSQSLEHEMPLLRTVEGLNKGETVFVFKPSKAGIGSVTVKTSVLGASSEKTTPAISIADPYLSIDRSQIDQLLVDEQGFPKSLLEGQEYVFSFKVRNHLDHLVSDAVINTDYSGETLKLTNTNNGGGSYSVTLKPSKSGILSIKASKQGYDASTATEGTFTISLQGELECGDGICNAGETPESCPQDCEEPPFPWEIVTYATIGLLIVIIIIVFVKRRSGY